MVIIVTILASTTKKIETFSIARDAAESWCKHAK